ncbi:hypothetical protein MPSEU_000536300 [Mayamaea pseudoterrestris]|nr:hypothetical protein MPSEU_000536300 [Mayamaea pseudoterrestris]
MWGNFGGINLKDLAEKAKAAAEKLDKQLNESVGVETPTANRQAEASTSNINMEGLDDAWGDDDEDVLLKEVDNNLKVDTENALKDYGQEGQLKQQETAAFDSLLTPIAFKEEDDPPTPSQDQHESIGDNGWNGDMDDENLQLDEPAVDGKEHGVFVAPQAPLEENNIAFGAQNIEREEDVSGEQLLNVDHASEHIGDEYAAGETQNGNDPFNENGGGAESQTHSFVQDSIFDQNDQFIDGSFVAPPNLVTDEHGNFNEEASVDKKALAGNHSNEVDKSSEEGAFDFKPNIIDDRAGAAADENSCEPITEEVEQQLQQHDTPPPSGVAINHDNLLLQEQLQQLQAKLQDSQMALQQREEQLMSKTEQLAEIESMHEKEKDDLRQKIKDTKEEAKKRIQKAKERVEATELQLQTFKAAQSNLEDDVGKQAAIIAELRAEGESLARKQADMEMAVRAAKGDAREIREALEHETASKEKALNKIELLEKDLKETKENLAAARRGESMADKFEEQLRKAKEEDERKGSLILSLEQQLKELKVEARDLMAELESSQKGAAVETQQTVKRLRKELSDAMAEMEAKLHKTEKDAQAREDALRREVDEVRKRWQDAVRRADSLSMDIQSSTAPLLRQLESAERQSRARGAAAAEIETKLRTELEDTIMSKEKLAKERNEFNSKLNLLERAANDNEHELKATKQALDERIAMVNLLETKIVKLETEMSKKQEQWKEVERLANEGVSRVRIEMTQTVVDSEERHRSQLDSIQKELSQEREKRCQLEQQLSGLLENASMLVSTPQELIMPKEVKQKKLRQSEGQIEILAGALGGLGRLDGDEEETESDDDDGLLAGQQHNGTVNSFAALAEMQSRMKATKRELEDLRRSLIESEKAKERLVIVLRDGRNAKEKLPLFEARCQELTEENQRLEMEVDVLTEEMEEMRLVYRSQLEAYMMALSSVNAQGQEQSPVDDLPTVAADALQSNGNV